MALDANVVGLSGTKAEVNAGNQLYVTAETDVETNPGRVGAFRGFYENDPGSVTGTALLKSPEVSDDWRLRVGVDTYLFDDSFNATTQNTNNWAYTFATLTAAQPGAGTVNFSAVQGTTSAHGAFMRTFQYFPMTTIAPIWYEVTFGQFTANLVTNEVWSCGFGLPSAATTLPTDGVWLQLTSSGLILRQCYNGAFTDSGVISDITAYTVGQLYKHSVLVGNNNIQVWRDDVLLYEAPVPSGKGEPFLQGSLPFFMMKHNTGAVSNTNTMRASNICISMADIGTYKPWADQLSGGGGFSGVGQNGQTQGSTSGGFNNTAIATTAAGSNTAANVTGLGGLGVMTAQATNAGAAGDMIATSYQNPAATVNITGKNLYITGVRISCMNTGAAVATTPTSLIWGVAWGHTAVSLATAETASFATATTHAPRRIPIGMCSAAVGTAVGGMYDRDLSHIFSTPICVRPGEFIATTVRFRVGTATASQELTYTVTFDGCWE